jgi:hypothetical protein
VIPELAHLARDVRHGDCVAGDVRAEHGWVYREGVGTRADDASERRTVR